MTLRLWPRSLIARILLVELAAILVAAITLPTMMVWLLHQQVNRYQIETLTEQAQEISRGLVARGNSLSVTLKPDLADTYATPYDGRAYVIADALGNVRTQSAFADRVPWELAPRKHRRDSFRDGTTIGVSVPMTIGPDALWVIVTQDEAGRGAIIDDVAHAFVTRYAPILLAILLLLPLINSLLIRRLVTAVRAVSEQAGTIGPQTLDVRLHEAGLPLEVAPLAHATNDLLVRLQQSFQQQSEFVANVAHELRTPLATLKVQLDAVEEPALRRQLGHSVDRLGHVVAQLQALASLEVAALTITTFDLVALARETVADLAPQIIANGDSISLETQEREASVRGNRTLIALALSNLITNATRHTPPGTSILVRLSGHTLIEVIDDGPGIASANPEAAIQRYWRADTQRGDSAGLGLSIVARIMHVHHGDLRIENDPGKGAHFTLHLPARDDL